MKLRAPAVPLITVDPYFSVWSGADELTAVNTMHWTGKPNTILGEVCFDGKTLRFMGMSESPAMKQISLDITALKTTYVFACDEITVTAEFSTPLLPKDLYLLSRPVSYLKLTAESNDGVKRNVSFKVSVSEEICLNLKGQYPVVTDEVAIGNVACMRMGSAEQKVLNRDGDDVRIEWGYFYLGVRGEGTVSAGKLADMTALTAEVGSGSLILFAYDDIQSLVYFGKNVDAWWKKDGKTIEEAIAEAAADYEKLDKKCVEFSSKMFADGVIAGGEKYAELLALAYRQVIAAHKLADDGEGNIIFVSKECFSNGCAATVDVSYPSIPMFLHYNPELVKGMMRPIFKYAAGEEWTFDFAPHDAGRYPFVNGQVYGKVDGKQVLSKQMPVEECGNMLVMAAAVAVAQGNLSFIRDHLSVYEDWAQYLIRYGTDPENQLCTDDFAGHLAHNCNLSLKAIMGLAGVSIIFKMAGQKRKSADYMKKAKEMAEIWQKNAANGDGSYRLAFDRPGTFSMKYNAVWDKLFCTEIFDPAVIRSELASNFSHVNPYGMPLDNRAKYTKSDWLVWVATMMEEREDFERFIAPLWNAYNYSPSRAPMTDWYDTITSVMVGFRHRTVMGGIFIKLMEKDFVAKSKKILGK
ncbi:MAG: DUF4965 domain-containing protein [Clostridia bacterium]|nr:DUF4965 domain-containing protein [Clostridia bacterium]